MAETPQGTELIGTILANAKADNIDLSTLGFLRIALEEIEGTSAQAGAAIGNRISLSTCKPTPEHGNKIDVHTHVVPKWYKSLVPTTGQRATPDWTFNEHLDFMAAQCIDRAILSFSAPGPNIFFGPSDNKARTVALARIINEHTAAYCRASPARYKFYAHVPLPYTEEAIIEAYYAVTTLGAVGIFLQSSVGGRYLGDPVFAAFFSFVNGLGGRQILYVHPAEPYIRDGENLILANPTRYPDGQIELYFETARTLMDLTISQTIHKFTNIHYIIPHVGGAFPSTVDRILKSFPDLYDSSFEIYKTRFWWDSAGPTYFHQISGLLGMGVPKSQLLFGTSSTG